MRRKVIHLNCTIFSAEEQDRTKGVIQFRKKDEESRALFFK